MVKITKLDDLETIKANDDELTAAFSGPAILSNRFTVTVGASVRIAFLEHNIPDGGKPQFRTAVSMHHQDAILLYRLLRDLLQETEKEINNALALHAETPKNNA